jgi:bacterial/archaeal transporter family protein
MDYLWIIFALLSAITAAAVAIFGKLGLQGIDTNLATAVRAVIMSAFLIVVVLLQGKLVHLNTILSNNRAMLFILLSGIAGALSWLFYFMALKLGKASQVAPIDRLSVVFVIILSFLILGEKITWKVAVGTAMMVAGAIIIALG